MRILLIEDDRFYNFAITRALRHHDVLSLFDGEGALKILKENPIDLVITDIMMPNQEGMETISLIRDKGYNIPIIAMSGDSFYLEIALELGANQVIEKPFRDADLYTIIDNLTKNVSH